MSKLSAVTVPLATPVTVGGHAHTELTLRKPRTGELRKLHRAGAFSKLAAIGAKAEKAEKAEKDGTGGDPFEMLAVFDDLAPVVAILAGVDEAVIDALEVDDCTKLFAALGQIDIASFMQPPTSAP